MNLSYWNYLYNWDGKQWIRANLVYTPYVSLDKKTLCMSFNRDNQYHTVHEENTQWTDELLTERFLRELKFHDIANKNAIPTLEIIDLDEAQRHIYFKWHGDDFFMQGVNLNGYNNVLSNWKDQWLQRINEMWQAGIYKISLHPNSWIAHDGMFIPFNWFFCFNKNEQNTIRNLLIQISEERQEKLTSQLNILGFDLDTYYDPDKLQLLAFHSFKSNYPEELIDQVIKNHALLQ
jgi:hypothetical protein